MVYFASPSIINNMVQPSTTLHVGGFSNSRLSEIDTERNVNSHRNHHHQHSIYHDNMDRRDQPENMEMRDESLGRRESVATAESGRRDLERGDNIGGEFMFHLILCSERIKMSETSQCRVLQKVFILTKFLNNYRRNRILYSTKIIEKEAYLERT